MANTYLQRTMGTATNRNIFTLSMWVKMAKTGNDLTDYQFSDFYVSGSIRISLYHNDDDTLRCHMEGGGTYTSNLFTTNAKLRDKNAWYHLVWRFDTTQATASDRVRLYINGELATFSDYNAPAQNFNLQQGTSSYTHYIGRYGGNTDNNFDGIMSHVHFCDGYSYAPTEFGETDSTTGEWKIKTSPSVSYGNNGFFILKDGNSGTDQSGQGNNLTVSGTLTKTEDNPSNVFATINTLLDSNQIGSTVEFSSGNTNASDPNGQASGINPTFLSTIGMPSKGKWYCEVRPASFSTGSGHSIGIYRSKGALRPADTYSDKIRYIYADTAIYIVKYGSNDQTGLTSISSEQTVGMALDLDNGTLQYYVNGVARANQITGINSANDGYDYFFMCDLESSSSARYGIYRFNFGNGAFASTQLTGTTYQDSNGQGIFQYQPPTNFLALCTKNLNV